MQVFYSQMCDLIKLGLNGRVFQCPQKNAPLCAILRRRKKAHSKICSTHYFVVILQRHSFRRVMVFRYLYHEETPKKIYSSRKLV